jgi:hypothetical protein
MPGQRTMRSRAATLLRGGELRVAQKRNPTKAACAWWGHRQDKGWEKTRRGGSLGDQGGAVKGVVSPQYDSKNH